MSTARIRALAGMSLLASAIGLAVFGATFGDADATPTHQAYGTYTLLRLRDADVRPVLRPQLVAAGHKRTDLAPFRD